MQLQCENFGFISSIGNHLKPSIVWETNLHLLRPSLRRKYYIKLMKRKGEIESWKLTIGRTEKLISELTQALSCWENEF